MNTPSSIHLRSTGEGTTTPPSSSTAVEVSHRPIARVNAVRRRLRYDYRPDELERTLRAIIDDAERTGDHLTLTAAHLELATVARYQRRLADAAEHADKAWTLAQDCSDRSLLALVHLEQARIDIDLGRDPENQLALARTVFDPSHELDIRIDYIRARAARRNGDLVEANRLVEQAVEALADRRSSYCYAKCLTQLGLVEMLRGSETAEHHLREALELAESGGFRRLEAYCLFDLGQIALRRHDFGPASTRLEAAASCFVEIGDPVGAAHAHSALGAVSRLTDEVAEAIEVLTGALEVFVDAGDLAGEALAHRRLAQCYTALLPPKPDPLDPADVARAAQEVALAIEQFERLGIADGEATALAVRGKLVHRTEGPRAALELTMKAIALLGTMQRQFRQGLEQLQFGKLHSWVYGFAMLCAAECDRVADALFIASALRAETLGDRARQMITQESGRLGELLGEICDHERALTLCGGDAMRHGSSSQELRKRRTELFEALLDEMVGAITPPLERPRPGPGHFRLCVQRFDDTLYVQCEGSEEADSTMAYTVLEPKSAADITALSEGHSDLWWDGRPRRWERLGEVILPDGLQSLREKLVKHQVEILEIEPTADLHMFPFGALRVDGHPLDELTRVLLSPGDLPSSLGLGERRPSVNSTAEQADVPAPARHRASLTKTVDAKFQAIVDAELDDLKSWSRVELVHIATGNWQLKRLFTGDGAAESRFHLGVHRYREQRLSLLDAVYAAKRDHRRGCAVCPPAHVGGFVVGGRLEGERLDVGPIQ